MERETAEERYKSIMDHFDKGGAVATSTYIRTTIYKPKHRAMFSYDATSLYVQSGKSRVSLNFTPIRFSILPLLAR